MFSGPPSVTVTQHARERARKRFSNSVSNRLERFLLAAERVNLRTSDGLDVYRFKTVERDVWMLVLDKHGETFRELEVVTVITHAMFEDMSRRGKFKSIKKPKP